MLHSSIYVTQLASFKWNLNIFSIFVPNHPSQPSGYPLVSVAATAAAAHLFAPRGIELKFMSNENWSKHHYATGERWNLRKERWNLALQKNGDDDDDWIPVLQS